MEVRKFDWHWKWLEIISGVSHCALYGAELESNAGYGDI